MSVALIDFRLPLTSNFSGSGRRQDFNDESKVSHFNQVHDVNNQIYRIASGFKVQFLIHASTSSNFFAFDRHGGYILVLV